MSGGGAVRLELAGLAIGYGRNRVAGPLDATLLGGRVHALTGPNGAGKTTLVRTVLGFLPPLAGTMRGLEGVARSYVPQIGSLDAGFPVTVEEVVATGLRGRCGGRDRRARIAGALAAVAMDATRTQRFFELSVGQRQRVLLARALCADAEFIVLDEPTAGVDAAGTGQMWEWLRDVAGRGKLVLVVTHDLFHAPDRADHVLVLADGVLRERTP